MPSRPILIAIILLLAANAGTAAWGFFERNGKLRWKAEAQSATTLLESCQAAAERQNAKVEELRLKMEKLRKDAERTLRRLAGKRAETEKLHKEIEELKRKPGTSCDSAWDDIEHLYRDE